MKLDKRALDECFHRRLVVRCPCCLEEVYNLYSFHSTFDAARTTWQRWTTCSQNHKTTVSVENLFDRHDTALERCLSVRVEAP